jgi:coenzyme F420-0:L-glutamate ligase/coenzyme F420-1:gamma-L-glutamate ligase
MGALAVRSLAGIPEVQPGDDLARLIHDASPAIAQGAVLAIAHTVVSRAEGAVVSLSGVRPGARALRLAAEHGKDPRVVQVVLDQSAEVLRVARGVIVSRTSHGFVCANAGVDVSNAGDADTVVLLPRDPDSSARAIRARLAELSAASRPSSPGSAGPPPAVLITDTFGRAWRHGQTDVAIGLAGMHALEDWRGRRDASGTVLRATWIAIADAAAAAADLARSKDSREPVTVIEGLERFVTDDDGPGAAALVRPADEDLFR